MKSVFDTAVREELSGRISQLRQQNIALWGKMNVSQMIRHCIRCDDMYFGKITIPRAFIGRLFGKMVLKQVLKDESPFRKNSPTSPMLTTGSEAGDIEQLKSDWQKGLDNYANYTNPGFVHPFFGPLTKEQVGYLAYKHADHHLRQFGV